MSASDAYARDASRAAHVRGPQDYPRWTSFAVGKAIGFKQGYRTGWASGLVCGLVIMACVGFALVMTFGHAGYEWYRLREAQPTTMVAPQGKQKAPRPAFMT